MFCSLRSSIQRSASLHHSKRRLDCKARLDVFFEGHFFKLETVQRRVLVDVILTLLSLVVSKVVLPDCHGCVRYRRLIAHDMHVNLLPSIRYGSYDHRAAGRTNLASKHAHLRKSGFACMYAQHGRVVVGCVDVCRRQTSISPLYLVPVI